ncbi:MAG: hypothetical protein SGPRY_006406, partial [Prymnesium sp.]
MRPPVGSARRLLSTQMPMKPPFPLFGVSGRYTNALYCAAAKKGTLVEVGEDLELLKETLEMSPQLHDFVVDPSISRGKKKSAMTQLMEAAKAEEVTTQMMVTMAEAGRMSDIFNVMTLYDELLTEARGHVKVV